MSDDLLSVEEMAEIPKDISSAKGRSGCSKGVNLFLARQKLIADMMEQEDSEQTDSSAGKVSTGGCATVAETAHHSSQPHTTTSRPSSYVMISAEDQKKRSAEAISEIPDTSLAESGSNKSKGVNLFLARQKLIADMMEAEEEEARAAEDAKRLQEEQERKKEELRHKQEAERIKMEELKRIEREKLEESERKKAARASKFKTSKAQPVTETVNRVNVSRDIGITDHSWGDDDNCYLRISESPPESTHDDDGRGVERITHLHLSEDDEDVLLEPKNFPEFSLPKSQPPTVTLLQKSRDAGCSGSNLCSSRNSTDDMHKIRECLAAPALYSGEFAGEIPKGALYVGTNERIEGGYKHTDQFFLVPAVDHNSNQSCGQERDDNSESQSNNLSQNSQQHRQDKCQGNGQRQSADTNNNASKPSALTPNTTLNERATERAHKDKPTVKQKPAIRKNPTSLATDSSYQYSPAHSTLLNADNEEMVVETLVQDTSASTQSPHLQTERSLSVDTDGGYDNPFNSDGAQTTSRSCSIASGASLSSPSHQYKEIQRGGEIPFSGLRKPAPITPPPRAEAPKKIPEPVAGYDRSPAPLPRVQRDRSDAKRRELLSKVEQDERRKKAREEEVERRARRHSDYFTLKEKSPIPRDRYDGPFFVSMSAPQSPARSTTSQNSPRVLTSETKKPRRAVALYHFNAQHPRELSVHKDERVFITRRVDGNWYEVSKNGKRGIVPVTYLEVLRQGSISPPPPLRPTPPALREGSAVAKFNFNPQSEAELALRRGDQVSLIKRVDPNWYQGRLQGSATTGIFPVSYVQVISEPVQEDTSHRSTTPVNRPQSAPNGTSGTPVSPIQYYTPTEHTPSSGYGSTDQIMSNDSRSFSSNDNNNNYYRDRKSSTDVNQNGHSIIKSGQPRGGFEMPSYKSMYNYEPHNDDELQLKQGDIVHVIEKCADGWFVGTSGRTGLFGTFPGNYVTPV